MEEEYTYKQRNNCTREDSLKRHEFTNRSKTLSHIILRYEALNSSPWKNMQKNGGYLIKITEKGNIRVLENVQNGNLLPLPSLHRSLPNVHTSPELEQRPATM